MGIASRELKDFPLIEQPFENVEDVQVDQWGSTIMDFLPVVVEGKIQLVKRPGLTEWINLGTGLPIDGLYWWDRKNCAVAVSGGRVWKILDSVGTRVELTGSSELRSASLVKFATDGNRLVMANGGRMVHTELTTLTTMADAQAPTNVSHVAEIDGYLLANVGGTGQIQFSSFDDFLSWIALDFVTAESKPDDVVAIGEAYRELIAVGRETVEFFQNDGVSPFSRITGSAQPFGTEAPHSLANVGGIWMWLSDKRELVMMQGRAVTPVSSPFDKIIQEFAAVNDAVGYTTMIGGHAIYLLNFPTAGQTLAFNHKTKVWHKWGYWDTERARYGRFRGQTYTYARAWNAHLVGDYSNGIIYKASRSTYTDNGNPIRSLVRTGHISHGTMGSKRSNLIRLKAKRGLANDACPDPQISMRRRVNNGGKWTNERWKSLGKTGDHINHLDWRRNGMYQTQQLEFVHSDPTDCILIGGQEDVEYLGQ